MKKISSRRRARWAARACAAGAAIAVAAGTGGTAMAATAQAIPIPVPCSAVALASAISGAPDSAILVLQKGCTYQIPASLPEVTSNLTIEGSGDTLTPASNSGFTALEVSDAQLTISHLTFGGFRTGTDTTPGALINDGGTLTITSSRFIGNTGGDDGGAILSEDSAILHITSTAFLDNYSGDDDCVAVRHTARHVRQAPRPASQHAIAPNTCIEGYGGAISNESGSNATLLSDSFLGNYSTEDGGAIYIGGGTVTVRGMGSSTGAASDFTGNTAEGDYGGAIDNDGGNVVVSYAAFSHNSSDSSGGAIENDGGFADVSGSKFSENDSTDGGAIETDSGPLNLTNDLFTGNSAYDGGAVITYNDTTTLNKTVVTENHATNDGGGIYLSYGAVSVTNGSLVVGNTPDNCYGFSC